MVGDGRKKEEGGRRMALQSRGGGDGRGNEVGGSGAEGAWRRVEGWRRWKEGRGEMRWGLEVWRQKEGKGRREWTRMGGEVWVEGQCRETEGREEAAEEERG